MKILLGVFLSFLSISASAIDCDKAGAINLRSMFLSLSTWEKERGHIAVHWTYEIEKDSREKQLKMIRVFADVDACMSNDAREIWFYRNKKLMGVASPE